jgi:hypothetical protein
MFNGPGDMHDIDNVKQQLLAAPTASLCCWQTPMHFVQIAIVKRVTKSLMKQRLWILFLRMFLVDFAIDLDDAFSLAFVHITWLSIENESPFPFLLWVLIVSYWSVLATLHSLS